uniref:Uncharacterized protein n=1 Tax=viral metagenome TaxID=1070528 RepID=A0A6M3JTV7_9ZZZZ
MNINLLRRGEKVYDEVSANLAPRDKLYCYALTMGKSLPKCEHCDPFGFCTAPAKDRCFTIRDLLKCAEERKTRDPGNTPLVLSALQRDIAEMELKVLLEPDTDKKALYRAALKGYRERAAISSS